jgi:glycosyltransferase involved in cell wall biosynthesis
VSVSGPSVVIGAALHNRAEYLPEALDSLLAQSFEQFGLVLVDDGSTDDTESVARAYEQRDRRVRYVKFDERRGMVAAWRKAFEEATAAGAEYFAWGSDHDRWHPNWLATLVDTLEGHPEVVLAYPLTQRIDPAGMLLDKPARRFETFGVEDWRARWSRISHSDSLAAGDMVYGLARAEALRRAGVFREVLCPDRLLVAELTLQGQIRQVPETLWIRRQFAEGSILRQRTTLFAPGAPRPSAHTPPWYLHARSLWATYGRKEGSSLGLSRVEVSGLIVEYATAYARRHYKKSSHPGFGKLQRGLSLVLGWPRWVYKRAKHTLLLALYTVLIVLRKVGATPHVERLCARLTGRARPWRRST